MFKHILAILVQMDLPKRSVGSSPRNVNWVPGRAAPESTVSCPETLGQDSVLRSASRPGDCRTAEAVLARISVPYATTTRL